MHRRCVSSAMDEKIRFAVAMRMGRAALGLNQQEFADLLGVAKSTVARNETLEMGMRADTLTTMLRVFREHGIEVDLLSTSDSLQLKVNAPALEMALQRLEQDSLRRADRKR